MIQTTTAQQPKGPVQATALPVQQKAKDQPIKPMQPKPEMGAAVQQPAPAANATPSDKAMVENRVAGLLDPSNALMRKAVAQAQGYNASRGLQSSSIGNEVALSTMVDKAQGIASQDAGTWAQFERDNATHNNQVGLLQMQQQFQSGESALNRDHESTLVDKQAGVQKELAALQNKYTLGQLDAQGQQRLKELQSQQGFESAQFDKNAALQKEMSDLQYQNQMGLLTAEGQQRFKELQDQQNFQSSENAINRDFQKEMSDLQNKQQLGQLDVQGRQRLNELEKQAELNKSLQELQHQQQLGLLDVQGKQQLQQMERSSELTTQRDSILQQYQKELNTQQNQQRILEIDKELNARQSMLKTELDSRSYLEYNNAVSYGYNNMLAQVGAVYSNPNMTPAQQEAGVKKITDMFKSQQTMLETLFGLPASGNGNAGTSSITGGNAPYVPPTGVAPPVTSIPSPSSPVKATQPVQPGYWQGYNQR